MSQVDTVVFYSLHNVGGSFGVAPSPIHKASEKAQAEASALQTVALTWGDLKIVLYVCDDIDDVAIHQWMNWLKLGAVGMQPGFITSRYHENATGEGFTDDSDDDEE